MRVIAYLTNAIDQEESGTPRIRILALLMHFLGTVVVATLAYALIRLAWFPDFFWQIAGGGELFFLICGVDAVLGPLLTFLVFNPAKGKRRLRRDLVVIVTLQVAALGYGLWTTSLARPLFLAYSVDRFNLVSAVDLTDEEIAMAERKEFATRSWGRPRVIGTREAKNSDEKIKLIESALAGKDRHLLPQTYVPFVEVKQSLLARARPLSDLPSSGASSIADVTVRWGNTHHKLGFVPVIAKGDWIMVVDVTSGELLEPLRVSVF